MTTDWQRRVDRWRDAGLIDRDQADRIVAFEKAAGAAGSSIFNNIIWALGGVLLAAGILLLVSAHWDEMSPALQFMAVLLLIASLHAGGALTAGRLAALSFTLHATGTAALGAGIYLAGQIFNLAEHWPAAILLWAIGAGCGWLLLRHWSQLLWVAVLVPAWLTGEWIDYTDRLHDYGYSFDAVLVAYFTTLVSVAYLSRGRSGGAEPGRKALAMLGAIAFVPAAGSLFAFSADGFPRDIVRDPVEVACLIAGFVLPLVPVWLAERRLPVANLIAIGWAVALLAFATLDQDSQRYAYGWQDRLSAYILYAAGGFGLVVWGLRETHRTRVNLGVATFAATVLAFYFSNVYDKLGRGLGLLFAGLLFIGGGWWLERARRRLIAQIRGQSA
ncbi:MAG TPA: DUF2157 domain-containing protein [Steroidobacteraceae bacterium]|nr:DUF2157 domain-containing protein [Steroidobacteraceae bacterium]